jgi:hypothetical protein
MLVNDELQRRQDRLLERRRVQCHRTLKCGHDGTLQIRPRRRWGEYAWRRCGRASMTWGYASGVVLLRRRSR